MLGLLVIATASSSAERCEGLVGSSFADIPDAPAHVTAAQVSSAEGGAAACRVTGYVDPRVRFELILPTDRWNGKFLHVGCGGLCGVVDTKSCGTGLRKGYACIASDMGHASAGVDGKWAHDNLQAEVDFGYRATHVATVAGKAITERYYGRAPQRAYFTGCSQGGRQGLVEAQRFPWDFDGIVAGAPVMRYNLITLHLFWASQLLQTAQGEPLLSESQVKALHQSVVQRCNAVDGVIADPWACRFDPATLECPANSGHLCLSAAQAGAVKELYAGAKLAGGERVYWGVLPGSELNWLGSLIGVGGKPPFGQTVAVEKLKYMTFMPDPGTGWEKSTFDLERSYRRLGLLDVLYDGTYPDLRRFQERGGKLLIYHGLGDPQVPPDGTVDYHSMVTRAMGGESATKSFLRLSLQPGLGHCEERDGARMEDFLAQLERWVEEGQAP